MFPHLVVNPLRIKSLSNASRIPRGTYAVLSRETDNGGCYPKHYQSIFHVSSQKGANFIFLKSRAEMYLAVSL